MTGSDFTFESSDKRGKNVRLTDRVTDSTFSLIYNPLNTLKRYHLGGKVFGT